ncbi:MAG: hypothetical protein KAR38_11900 [Calditrichia bacterium]|nr:hypothetical protein [Calditrichia bacterium]
MRFSFRKIEKYKVNKNLLNFFAVCLVVLTLLTQLNNSFFLHTHKLNNGNIVYHSHFFLQNNNDEGNTNAKHEHTSIENLFYFLLSVLNEFLLFAAFALIFQLFKQFRILSNKIISSQNNILTKYIPRSPPVFSL